MAAWKGHLECLNLMTDAKADINHQTSDGQNALSLDVRFGNISSLYALLDHPSDVPVSGHVKTRALIDAFGQPDVEFAAHNQTVAFTLMACGADVRESIKAGVPRDHLQSATSHVLGQFVTAMYWVSSTGGTELLCLPCLSR
jgi:hypothetical protein